MTEKLNPSMNTTSMQYAPSSGKLRRTVALCLPKAQAGRFNGNRGIVELV